MKLTIKNKVVTLGGSSFVKNEAGENVYAVKGRIISPMRRKFIKDMDGKTLYQVRNKWFTILFPKAYILDAEGNKIAKVRNDGILGFRLEGFKDEITVSRGVTFTREIFKNGKKIGETKRNIDVLRDSFTLEIDDGEDIPFFVALVIAIDNIRDNSKD